MIVYPSKRDKQVHLGTVTGEYAYKTKPESNYPHHRSVKWLKTIPCTHFSQGALYEIGSAMSFFQVKNYAEEFYAAVKGKIISPPVIHDETLS